MSNNTLASEVENFALGSIYALLKEYPSSEKQASILSGTTVPLKEQRDLDKTLSPQASAEKDRIRDKTVAHAELYFVLCSIKQELSAE